MPLIPGNLLSEDEQSIETSVAAWDTWFPAASAVTRVSTVAHDGTWSLRATSNGVGNDTLFGQNRSTVVTPNTQYTYSAWVYTTLSGHTMRLVTDYWRSDESTFTEFKDGTFVAILPSTWTQLVTHHTPIDGTTARAQQYIAVGTTPISGDFFYADEIFFGISGPPLISRNSWTS